jgi:hypothetical protein
MHHFTEIIAFILNVYLTNISVRLILDRNPGYGIFGTIYINFESKILCRFNNFINAQNTDYGSRLKEFYCPLVSVIGAPLEQYYKDRNGYVFQKANMEDKRAHVPMERDLERDA